MSSTSKQMVRLTAALLLVTSLALGIRASAQTSACELEGEQASLTLESIAIEGVTQPDSGSYAGLNVTVLAISVVGVRLEVTDGQGRTVYQEDFNATE